jgi:hypothetical protein
MMLGLDKIVGLKETYQSNGKPFPDGSISDGFVPDNSERLFETNKMRISVTKEVFERMVTTGNMPMSVKIKLEYTPPPAPSTSELLDGIPFRVPQVKIVETPPKTGREPEIKCIPPSAAPVAGRAPDVRPATFLAPTGLD